MIINLDHLEKLCQDLEPAISQLKKQETQPGNHQKLEASWTIGKSLYEWLAGEMANWETFHFQVRLISWRLRQKFGPTYTPVFLKQLFRFYQAFPNWKKQMSDLSWTHYKTLLQFPELEEITYYWKACIADHWSIKTLRRHIQSGDFGRTKGRTFPAPIDWLKDPYIFEFADLDKPFVVPEEWVERELLNELQQFLTELGSGFAFVAQQKRVSTYTGKKYCIDLVFYNYLHKCFVLVDLKAKALTYRDIGQMDQYVRYYDDRFRKTDDGPTLGIIICRKKDPSVVQYSLLSESKQIFAAQYLLKMPEKKAKVSRHEKLEPIQKTT